MSTWQASVRCSERGVLLELPRKALHHLIVPSSHQRHLTACRLLHRVPGVSDRLRLAQIAALASSLEEIHLQPAAALPRASRGAIYFVCSGCVEERSGAAMVRHVAGATIGSRLNGANSSSPERTDRGGGKLRAAGQGATLLCLSADASLAAGLSAEDEVREGKEGEEGEEGGDGTAGADPLGPFAAADEALTCTTAAQRTQLLEAMVPLRRRAGVALIRAGEWPPGLIYIERGSARVIIRVAEAGTGMQQGEMELMLNAGECCGSLSQLAAPDTVYACEDSAYALLPREQAWFILAPTHLLRGASLVKRGRSNSPTRDASSRTPLLPAMMGKLEIGGVFGHGGAGKVLFARGRGPGSDSTAARAEYAIKCIPQHTDRTHVAHVLREQAALSECDHSFLPSLLGAYRDSAQLFLVMDAVCGCELFYLLREVQRLEPIAAAMCARHGARRVTRRNSWL